MSPYPKLPIMIPVTAAAVSRNGTLISSLGFDRYPPTSCHPNCILKIYKMIGIIKWVFKTRWGATTDKLSDGRKWVTP